MEELDQISSISLDKPSEAQLRLMKQPLMGLDEEGSDDVTQHNTALPFKLWFQSEAELNQPKDSSIHDTNITLRLQRSEDLEFKNKQLFGETHQK